MSWAAAYLWIWVSLIAIGFIAWIVDAVFYDSSGPIGFGHQQGLIGCLGTLAMVVGGLGLVLCLLKFVISH
jgi:hypothetical protein